MKVYISGAISGTEGYKDKFHKAENYFKERGFDVVNPCKITDEMPFDYAERMELCLCMIKHVDGIALFPDWENSKGARLEKNYAETLGKAVWFLPHSLVERMKP